MNWIKNIESIMKKNGSGQCPFCQGMNTDYTIKKVVKDYGYCVIWCNDCKKAVNLSRVRVESSQIRNRALPDNLSFTSV